MRVISGTAGGRQLKSLPGDAVRPTADHVKEALFNILQFDLEGRRVLDLFGGTGQLGIEALSRGAREAVFTVSYLNRGEKFDIIFIDPPYDAGLYAPVLERINAVDNLNEGGIIICESRAKEVLPDLLSPYRLLRRRHYGSMALTFYTRSSE